jgi:hypothetical protein
VGDLTGWSNRVAEEMSCSAQESAVHHCLVPFNQLLSHGPPPAFLLLVP